MKAYSVSRFRDTIEEKEITRHTEKFVFILMGNGKERREGKNTSWEDWYVNEEEAVKKLRELLLMRIENARKEIKIAGKSLSNLETKYSHYLK